MGKQAVARSDLSSWTRVKNTPALLNEIMQRLRDNQSKREIAQWLQEEKKQCTKLTRATLERYIETLRAQAVLPMPSKTPVTQEPYILPKQDSEPVFELDESKEIAALFFSHKQRLASWVKAEEEGIPGADPNQPKVKKYNANLDRSYEVGAKLLQTSIQIKDIMGLLRPGGPTGPGAEEIIVRVQSKYGHQVASTIQNPQSRQRLISIMKKSAELAQLTSQQQVPTDGD